MSTKNGCNVYFLAHPVIWDSKKKVEIEKKSFNIVYKVNCGALCAFFPSDNTMFYER